MAVMYVLEREFDSVDKNSDGFLSRAEIIGCLERFGFDKRKAEEVIKLYDEDKDGKISKNEFMKATNKKLSQTDVSCAALRKIFREMDKNKDRTISKQELKNYMKSDCNFIFPIQVDQWVDKYDKNKDGRLNYEEFIEFVSQYL
uniref:16 kDa calcium-binding protein n=1 Tax=Schistosoma mansoni TaxID=6183 RepID=A0A5K4F4R6_SCHMA